MSERQLTGLSETINRTYVRKVIEKFRIKKSNEALY